jgi:serine O-acetyltransferase
MKLSLDASDLATYLARQVSNFFPDREIGADAFRRPVDRALERVEHCFGAIRNKYFPGARDAYFNHRHTDQYAMFLYFVSNSVYRDRGEPELAEKAYALNKALHGLDAFYEVELPAIFGWQHPVGTVLGRARYSDYFFVYQRCSTGAQDGVYPDIGAGVAMYGGSSIIGKCTIGSNVLLSAGTLVMGHDVPDNSVVFGQSPHLTIKPTRRNVFNDFFHAPSTRGG